MRRWSLALVLAVTSPVLAQPPAPAPTRAPPARQAPAAEDESDEPSHGAPSKVDPREQVRTTARFLFQGLLLGDVRSIAGELVYPFQLEDKKYGTENELIAAWVKELRNKRTDLVTLYDVEVLSFAEMEKKYGPPPARLGLSLKGQEGFAAVGNLSGRPAIFLLRATPQGWRPFAYTD
jgi:hypothetical protein